MDPTSRFFAKLRKVAVNLETQSAELQGAYDTRNDDEDDDEKTERATRACYELSCEVKEFKSQVLADLQQQRQRVTEVDRFLDACMVMKRKVDEDMDTIRKQCEKYGYQAPQNRQKTRGTEQEVVDDEEAGQGAEDAEKVGEDPPAPDPHPAASTADLQRTPQFSDFGLSEANLRRRMVEGAADTSVEAALGGADRGGAAAAASSSGYLRTPQFSDFGLSEVDLRKRLQGLDVAAPLPYSPPSMYMPSATPKTPKCALQMDDELHSPQAPYFGAYEHTMCLNNDFTMELQRKGVELQAAQSSTVSAHHPGTDGLASPDRMFPSPTPPHQVYSLPRIRNKRVYGLASSPPPEETPFLKKQPLTSPEVPQFESAYLNKALGRKMVEKHTGATWIPDLPTPANRTKPGQRPWEYDIPEMTLDDVVHTPETPEWAFGPRPAGTRGVVTGQTEPVEPSVPSLKLHDPMMSGMSPKMPDLSSETLTNIQHLLAQSKTVLPNHRPSGKENGSKVIFEVTQVEFQRLPGYLRQMPLSSLNQAVQKLNEAAADSHDENEEFSMSILKRMAGLDAVSKAPVYFLCLTELNRLRQVRGVGMNSEYRLITKNT